MVSEIRVGGHHLRKDTLDGRATAQERAAIFSQALDKGISFFDTTFKEEVIAFGNALRIIGARGWDAWDDIMAPTTLPIGARRTMSCRLRSSATSASW